MNPFSFSIIAILSLLSLISCGGNQILKSDAMKSVSSETKRNIKVYIESKNENVFERAVYEAFSHVFEITDTAPYEIKIVPELVTHQFDVLAEKCKGKKGNYSCEGKYRVKMDVKLSVHGSDKTRILELRETGEETSQAFDLALDRNTARSRTQSLGAGKANVAIVNRIIPKMVTAVCNDPQVAQIEQREKTKAELKYDQGQLPFTCILILPSNTDEMKAQGSFDRSFHINYEKQSATTSVDIGKKFRGLLLQELQARFSTVHTIDATSSGHSMTYNPYDLACLLRIHINRTEVKEAPSASVFFDGKATLEAATGDIYKDLDISSDGAIRYEKKTEFLRQVLQGVSLTKVATERMFLNQALENGCDTAVKGSVFKIMEEFDHRFVRNFSEFSAFSVAAKSKTPGDVRRFFSTYPNSQYAPVLTEVIDQSLYDAVIASESIEPCADYLETLPNGKYRENVLITFEQRLFAEIIGGNTMFCAMYNNSIPEAYRRDEVTRVCGAL